MSTYASEGDLTEYVAGTVYEGRVGESADEREQLLERAEVDLDQEAFPLEQPNATAGERKLAPIASLDSVEREALKRATCAQALYRLEMGDEHFVRAQRQKVTGRSFSAEGKLPIVGPGAWRELAAAGSLLNLTASVGDRRTDPGRWQAE